jgi:endoglycosylceramidase
MERRQFIAAGAAASVGLGGCLGGGIEAPGSDDGGASAACGSAVPSPPGTIDADGERFVVDGRGRVVFLHGVNVVYKREPYYPPPDAFDESDVEQISGWGFNFARLGAIWAGVEPERGEFDQSYLDRIRELVELFGEHGIYVLVDYHQNLYSHVLGGDGAPEWAVDTGGELDDYEYDDVDDWAFNYADPAVANALEHFFTNRGGIQDEYASAWRETAATLADEPNVVGYSLMNEPTPPVGQGIDDFETEVLPGMYNRVIEEIRTVDTETPVWVEPSAAKFNIGWETSLAGVEDPADSLVFSFHNYAGNNQAVIDNAVEATDRLALPGVQTEFSTGNSTTVARMVDRLDTELMGWAYWPYDESTKGWQSPAEYPPDFIGLDEGGGRKHLDYLVRPYPQAVAGVPTSVAFDRVAREFRLAYEPDADAEGSTVVFVPDRQFDDPAVSVDGAALDCRDGEYLHVGDHSADADTVTVTVSEEAVYRVESVHSGKALTAPTGDASDRTVHQHAWEGSDRQRWRVTPLGDGSYRFDCVASGETLAVRAASQENGADIVQRPWQGGDEQRWHVEVTANAANALRNAHSGLVADVADRSTADGATVHQWEYVDGQNQQWRLRPV